MIHECPHGYPLAYAPAPDYPPGWLVGVAPACALCAGAPGRLPFLPGETDEEEAT